MVNFKNNKGITLVMLVVTIIVLLILAGISISAITGGDSSMDKAKKAKDETAIKAEMEELQKIINQSAAKGIRHGNYSGSADSQTIRDALKKNKLIEENPDDVIIDGKNGWKVTGVKTGQKYKIRYDGEVTRIEKLAPTKIYGKIADGVLYLRATEQIGYTEGTKWNDSTITKVIIEEPIAPTTARDMFNGCTKLKEINGIENLHTENVTNMNKMFLNCSNLEALDVSDFDTSKVTDMAQLFERCSKIKKLEVGNFDTGNVKNITRMFYGCNNLQRLDVSNFNTNNVNISMGSMFFQCNSLTSLNVSNFKTSKVTSMDNMFNGCSNLESLDVSNFDTQNVTAMNSMFNGCSKIKKLNVKNFNTSKVKTMAAMFDGCNTLSNIDVSNFDTKNVESMANMFNGCSSLGSLNLINFNTSKVTSMINMFNKCSKLTELDLSSFNTSNVTKMTSMFSECYNLKTIYVSANFVVEQVTSYSNMFLRDTNLVGGLGTTYANTSNPRDKKYAHIDGGTSDPGFFTLKQ